MQTAAVLGAATVQLRRSQPEWPGVLPQVGTQGGQLGTPLCGVEFLAAGSAGGGERSVADADTLDVRCSGGGTHFLDVALVAVAGL